MKENLKNNIILMALALINCLQHKETLIVSKMIMTCKQI
jgi:hypothetical protein